MSSDEVEDLINQLNQLQLKQKDLLVRLERARDHEVRGTREFRIGDRVRIDNPKPSQERRGAISRIGKDRVTVLTASGKIIHRARKNLTLE
jgi:hypothetical protein